MLKYISFSPLIEYVCCHPVRRKRLETLSRFYVPFERRWKESKYPTRFSFTWSPTVCRIDQSTSGSDRCAPLYIETNTADRIGILICNRRTTVFHSGEQPTWKFPSVAQANFFSPPFLSHDDHSNQISSVPSNIFFGILKRSRFSFFFPQEPEVFLRERIAGRSRSAKEIVSCFLLRNSLL